VLWFASSARVRLQLVGPGGVSDGCFRTKAFSFTLRCFRDHQTFKLIAVSPVIETSSDCILDVKRHGNSLSLAEESNGDFGQCGTHRRGGHAAAGSMPTAATGGMPVLDAVGAAGSPTVGYLD